MSDKPSNDKGQVQSKQNRQTEEEIQSYWTPERQREAKLLPLPIVNPSNKVKKEPESQSPEANEVVAEPVEPDV